ncbi:MAG: glycosyltransferase [Flavisolibacter sp.]
MDLVCAIDLDTIVPCLFVSVLRRKKRVYDAHELFSEMKEVVTRPLVRRTWKIIESLTVPHFKKGYTVSIPIQKNLSEHYKINYPVILNAPLLEVRDKPIEKQNFIIYQGAVNEGRCFENLIPAFQWINCPLWILGDGNFLQKAKNLAATFKLEDKVIFKPKLLPEQLSQITGAAILGITIFENKGLSNYYSLANRFFDYIHAGIPQLCVNYPSYKQINDQVEVAVLIADLSATSIANAINELLAEPQKQKKLRENCQMARQIFNWQNEEIKLNNFYRSIFANER